MGRSRPRTFCCAVVSGAIAPGETRTPPSPPPLSLFGLIPLFPPPLQGEGRQEARARRAWGWGGARGSAAVVQLRRSMAGAAAHLLVWRPGPRGGRESRRAAGGRGHGGGGGRSSLGSGRTEPDSGRRRRRLGVCSSLPHDPVPRRQTDRPQRPRPPHPPPALLANCLSLSLPPSLRNPLSPGVLRGGKKN